MKRRILLLLAAASLFSPVLAFSFTVFNPHSKSLDYTVQPGVQDNQVPLWDNTLRDWIPGGVSGVGGPTGATGATGPTGDPSTDNVIQPRFLKINGTPDNTMYPRWVSDNVFIWTTPSGSTTSLPWDNITSRPTINSVAVTGAVLDNASNYPTVLTSKGGTGQNSASSTGTPYVLSGVWSFDNATTFIARTWTGSGAYLKYDGTRGDPAGSGDFSGPANSADNEVVLFSGTGGKTGKRSGMTLGTDNTLNLPGGIATTQGATGGQMTLREAAANGTEYRAFKVPDSLSDNIVFLLPATAPTDNQVLSCDAPVAGVSTCSWDNQTGTGGGATPAGTDNQIQMKNGSSLAAVPGLGYDGSDNTISGPSGGFKTPQSAALADGFKLYELSGNGTDSVGMKAPDNVTETYQLVLPGAKGTNGQILKLQSDNVTLLWANDAQSAGNNPSFDNVQSGINTSATMTVGSGASIGVTGSGSVTATALSAQYTDWSQSSGPTSIANKPTSLPAFFSSDNTLRSSVDNSVLGAKTNPLVTATFKAPTTADNVVVAHLLRAATITGVYVVVTDNTGKLSGSASDNVTMNVQQCSNIATPTCTNLWTSNQTPTGSSVFTTLPDTVALTSGNYLRILFAAANMTSKSLFLEVDGYEP